MVTEGSRLHQPSIYANKLVATEEPIEKTWMERHRRHQAAPLAGGRRLEGPEGENDQVALHPTGNYFVIAEHRGELRRLQRADLRGHGRRERRGDQDDAAGRGGAGAVRRLRVRGAEGRRGPQEEPAVHQPH